MSRKEEMERLVEKEIEFYKANPEIAIEDAKMYGFSDYEIEGIRKYFQKVKQDEVLHK